MTDPDAQFDVIGFETDLYDAAISKMREAKTASETLSYMARAISHGFAILEHIAPLRTVDAGRANDLSEVWRNVQDLIAMHDRTLRRRLDELERSDGEGPGTQSVRRTDLEQQTWRRLL